jgi:ADP-ribose pyrophosphatase YjhB (NUDIX family)
MNYCSNCGSRVVLRTPSGDDRPRYICDACHTIHYQNPRVVTGCIAQWEHQILLCRRAIEPRYGMWTLPAGFLENGESTAQAAARETLEEANARVVIDAPFSLIDIPRINQVYVMFRARLLALDYAPGSESLEVQLFREEAIPWGKLAFAAVEQTLVFFFEDRRSGRFRMHNEAIWRRPGAQRK